MSKIYLSSYFVCSVLISAVAIALSGCGAPPAPNVNSSNTQSNANFNANANVALNSTGSSPSFAEPESYQAIISLKLEAIGQQQNVSMPPLQAVVARSGVDRAMQFTLPTNEKILYIEKGDMNFVVFPSRRQYAELNEEALGFEVRRLMMPEQIVQQLRSTPGVQFIGEETVNGRTVQKYVYGSATDTGTAAGTVTTESYFLIDKETGLPMRSAISSQSTSGGNVQGVQGGRLVTEVTDIKTAPDAELFVVPTDFQKIDPEQVKAQANLIFHAAAAVIGQFVNPAQASPSPAVNSSPPANR